MNSSLTVLLMTNKTRIMASSFFTNDKVLGWVSKENSKIKTEVLKSELIAEKNINLEKQN